MKTGGKASERAGRSDDAVAGDEDGDGIAPHGRTHGARGGTNSGCGEPGREGAIGGSGKGVST